MTPAEEALHWVAEKIGDGVETYTVQKWTLELPEPQMSLESDVLLFTREGRTFQVSLVECEGLPDDVA